MTSVLLSSPAGSRPSSYRSRTASYISEAYERALRACKAHSTKLQRLIVWKGMTLGGGEAGAALLTFPLCHYIG